MYNKLNALIYELIHFLCRFYPLRRKPWVRRVLDYCRDDWAAFRAEVAIKEVERQLLELHAAWERDDKQRREPIYTELPPDGSKTQDLLGGEIRLSSPWTSDKPDS